MSSLEPNGWHDRSTYRFMAPDKKVIVGRIMSAQLPTIRAQLSITSEEIDESMALESIMTERPLPHGVVPVSSTDVGGQPPQFKRVFRFNDPINGWLIQQSQTFIKDGNRLYTILLTADPLNFTAAEQEASRSSRIIQLIEDSPCP
jgi:hypothetical protein